MKRKLKLLLTSGFEEILYTCSEPGFLTNQKPAAGLGAQKRFMALFFFIMVQIICCKWKNKDKLINQYIKIRNFQGSRMSKKKIDLGLMVVVLQTCKLLISKKQNTQIISGVDPESR